MALNCLFRQSHGPEMSNFSLRTTVVLLWSLVPCLAIWVGLFQIKSAAWTYFLYHGLCLLPAIIWGRRLWLPTFLLPTRQHFALITAVALLFSAGTLIGYELIGKLLFSNEHALALLKQYGGSTEMLVALGAYTVLVNPVFEELFWRGVILNELDKSKAPFKHFGLCWSSCAYAALHYVIFRMLLSQGWAAVLTLIHVFYGALLAVIYRRTGSILTTILAHGLLTDLAFIVVLLDLFRHYPDFFFKLL